MMYPEWKKSFLYRSVWRGSFVRSVHAGSCPYYFEVNLRCHIYRTFEFDVWLELSLIPAYLWLSWSWSFIGHESLWHESPVCLERELGSFLAIILCCLCLVLPCSCSFCPSLNSGSLSLRAPSWYLLPLNRVLTLPQGAVGNLLFQAFLPLASSDSSHLVLAPQDPFLAALVHCQLH